MNGVLKAGVRSKTKRRSRGPEAQLKSAVVDCLRMIPGVHVLRMNAGVMHVGGENDKRRIHLGEVGTPDLLVMLPCGRSLWLELKAPSGTLSPAQAAWHERARKLGHTVHVVRDTRDAIDLVTRSKAGMG